jgi:GT2 family glycosyltransferase
MKDLSIIIVNTNNRKILEECLTSIEQSTHLTSYEVIVSDNASTDGSREMIRNKFPKVALIANPENLGFIKASNLGLKINQGRYAMLLNDDTIVKDGALDRMVAFMDKHPEAGACGAKLLNIDGTIQRQGGLFGQKFWRAQAPVTVDFVIGAALLVRREVIDQVGVMDENLFFYNDDLDWCLSIRQAGHKIYFLPDAEIIHYGGYSSKRKFNRRLFVEGFKGGLYFCRKHYGELAYSLYRLCLCLCLCLCLPFHIFNKEKLLAYGQIIALAASGQVPRPVIK